MTQEQVESAIADLMIQYGPDGHCDGHEIIAAFAIALADTRDVARALETADAYAKGERG